MEIKSQAMQLAPGGSPRFDLLISEHTTQISTLNRTIGKQGTAKLIMVILEDLNNYFNVARPMTGAQMIDLAIEMADQLWSFRVEEILAFAEAMKKGTYGKIFERLDPAIIWQQFEGYFKAREDHLIGEQGKYKQSDPIIEDVYAQENRKTNKAAGSIAASMDILRNKFKTK